MINNDWLELAANDAWLESQRIIRDLKVSKSLALYQNDPVAFGTDVLGEFFTQDIQRVMQSVRDHRVTIAKSGNDVGKSHAAARIAVWFYRCFPDAKVFITAAPPLENLRRILWGELRSVIRDHPNLFLGDKMKALEIRRHDQSFIAGVAIPTSGSSAEKEAKFSGKHAPHLLFIVDEGDAVPDEIYRGIESCMSGEYDRLLIMFNPRAAVGSVYMKEVNRQANVVQISAINHPNVLTGDNVIPGCVSRETTVRRYNEWTRQLMPGEKVTHECVTVPDFLVGLTADALDGRVFPPLEAGYRRVEEPAFYYMVLGEYPSQSETQLINYAWIDEAVNRHKLHVEKYGALPPADVNPIMGLDIAEHGTDSNVCCLRYDSYVANMIFWKGIDVDATSIRALEIHRQYNVNVTMVDGTGPGSSVAPAMARRGKDDNVRAISVKVSNKPSKIIKSELGEFFSLRDQLWWAAREWLRTDNNAMLPNDRLLIDELKAPTYKIDDGGKIRVTKKDALRDLLRRSPDRADALCLTFLPMPRAKVMRLFY